MEAVVRYPASFGEIIQGRIDHKDILCSCPINLFTEVKTFESKEPKSKYNHVKSAKFLSNLLTEWGYEDYIRNFDIEIQSNIPEGKGFASSTADLCGVYYSLLKLFNRKYEEDELIRHCINIEPTDSIIFKDMTIFDYKEGKYKRKIGSYCEFNILVFEGSRIVDTVEFNKKPLPPLSNIEDLAGKLIKGVEDNDVKTIAYCATESIIRNEGRLSYSIIPLLLKLKDEIGGYGIIGAHSGDALGIIYEGNLKMEALNKYLSLIKGYKIYNTKTIKI